MWLTIAEGNILDIWTIVTYENEVNEGQRARITLNLRSPISQEISNELQQQLDKQGVTDAEVSTRGNDMNIIYRKGFPWAVVIVGIIVGLIALAILIVSWRFAKEAPIPYSLTMVALALGAAAVLGITIRRWVGNETSS